MKDDDYSVLSQKLGGGPMGLGDPNDRTLRKVEKDVLVPKLMREKTKAEKCVNEVKEFHECCLNTGVLNVVKCRQENDKMKACMEKWYYNEDFIKECTDQYLNERSEFRKTGISIKQKSTRMQSASM
ncbi:COX assembly mitochondrial protein homolog [Linepithema humile]|uniref:COX assembly mitochondrial protein homolog n=1 Tax=Linepithema humile TaxID=83485 RepID=UPI000623840F|nr:PREDICTED: COX assembly mitochondrial protein homolog [Linepithema humile]